MTTWKKEIEDQFKIQGESWVDVEFFTLSEDEANKEFDDGYGGTEGQSFFLWTKNRVYFSVCYDGAEWVESVPRNPCDEEPQHFGGG